MLQLVALRLKPEGRLPEAMAKLNGVVPPLAEQAPEYATPTVPFENPPALSVNTGAIVMLSA
jgi:hypothetical protein